MEERLRRQERLTLPVWPSLIIPVSTQGEGVSVPRVRSRHGVGTGLRWRGDSPSLCLSSIRRAETLAETWTGECVRARYSRRAQGSIDTRRRKVLLHFWHDVYLYTNPPIYYVWTYAKVSPEFLPWFLQTVLCRWEYTMYGTSSTRIQVYYVRSTQCGFKIHQKDRYTQTLRLDTSWRLRPSLSVVYVMFFLPPNFLILFEW